MEKTKLLIGTRKGLIVYTKRGSGKWIYDRTEFLGIPVSIATIDERTSTWWALLDHGHWGCKLHRSHDGVNWEELESPKYPEGTEIKEGVAATTRYLWAFGKGTEDEPNTIYIGTEPGGLFKSSDNGDHFELITGLWEHPSRKEHWFGGGRDHAGIHSIIVDQNDSDHMYVGISVAGVFETRDGGKSWNSKNKGLKADFLPDPDAEVGQDPHLLVSCEVHPEVMWQQNHCGIFRSVNGGEQWKDISEKDGPAVFGFAIQAHPINPELAWVAPGVSDIMRVAVDQALCISRTEDGGKTWKALRNGLPQEACYDIVYRHAMDLTGDTLVFGTTTGNFYISNDLGDQWKLLNNNLPMVYSVEFA